MRLVSLASGSNGNCTYVGTDDAHFLIDTGCSFKRMEEGLHALDLTMSDMDAIFITHEHADHIASLHTVLKKHRIPLYMTPGTAEGIRNAFSKNPRAAHLLHDADAPECHYIKAGNPVVVKGVTAEAIRISHDALEPVAYRFTNDEKQVGVATDLGCFDDETVSFFTGMDALLLEANHDVNLLQAGPYPYRLKCRIMGDKGHLSNEASGELLTRLLHDRLKGIILGHLSEHNNYPALAYETVRLAIEMGDVPYHGNDFPLFVAGRTAMSAVISV